MTQDQTHQMRDAEEVFNFFGVLETEIKSDKVSDELYKLEGKVYDDMAQGRFYSQAEIIQSLSSTAKAEVAR